MKRITNIFLGIFFLPGAIVLIMSAAPVTTETAVNNHFVVDGLAKAVAAIKSLTYTMVYSEKLDGSRIHSDSSFVKLQRTPHKIYMKMSDGAEVLWGDGMNNGNALVHPNSFPFVTLELDPDGLIMRKDQHHGVENAGYDYFASVLARAATNAGKDFDKRFLYLGEMTYDGAKCYKLIVIDPAFKYIPYTVLKGETVMSIAKKLWVNEYMIMQHNNLSSYTDVNEGQSILVPNDYGQEMTLYIQESNMLPLLLRVDDEKGLYEQYIFHNLKFNPTIAANDFSKDNKDYHF